jgi:hypothetical protein
VYVADRRKAVRIARVADESCQKVVMRGEDLVAGNCYCRWW